LMHVLRSQQQLGRASRQSVTWITKQDWRSWNYSITRWTTGHGARFTHNRENSMSRRGIHPLLRGLDRPQRVAPSRRAVLLSGLESAQRKRYLRSEAEESETSQQAVRHRSSQWNGAPAGVDLFLPTGPWFSRGENFRYQAYIDRMLSIVKDPW